MSDQEKFNITDESAINLINTLIEEIKIVKQKAENSSSQIDRRTYFRVGISFVEGTLFTLKEYVYTRFKNDDINLSRAEIAILCEETYDLNDKGKAYKRPYYSSFKSNIKFTFNICIKAFDLDYSPRFEEEGWNYLLESVQKRNNITHPKNEADLEITEDEVQKLSVSMNWYLDHLLELNYLINQTYQDEIQELKDQLNSNNS